MTTLRSIFALTTTLMVLGGCGSPGSSTTRRFDSLVIRGTPQFDEQVGQALALLKAKSPAAYALATNQVGIIREGTHSGMRAGKEPPVFDLNARSAFYSISWCAGVIAHDSFHSKLYHDYKQAHWAFVPRKVWTGQAAEAQCLEHQLRVLREIGAPDNEIDYCRTLTPDYSDVPYRKRNW